MDKYRLIEDRLMIPTRERVWAIWGPGENPLTGEIQDRCFRKFKYSQKAQADACLKAFQEKEDQPTKER